MAAAGPNQPLAKPVLPRLPVDEHEVPEIDEDAERLTEDEDRIAPVDGIGQKDQPAREREVPEHDRHHRPARPFRGNPLDEEAAGEHELAEQAEGDPPELGPAFDMEDGEEPLHPRPPPSDGISSSAG